LSFLFALDIAEVPEQALCSGVLADVEGVLSLFSVVSLLKGVTPARIRPESLEFLSLSNKVFEAASLKRFLSSASSFSAQG